jgi:hypothetical protein
MKIPLMKQISWYLTIVMFIIGIAPRVDAAFSPSQIIGLAPTDRSADLERIRTVLEAKAVGERLKQLGFTAEEIQSRLSQLNDRQIHQIALRLDNLKVGKDGALGIIIALLVIAILVVVLLKLTGHKVIVTK